MKITFIGAGKMATAMAGGIVERGVCAPADIIGTDVLPRARQAFSDATGCQTMEENHAAIAEADVIILAVKPQVAQMVLAPLNGHFHHALVVSIAAGLTLRSLIEWCQTNRVVRVMPNTPALVGLGASAYACADGVKQADREAVEQILGAIGVVACMDEVHLDAVTGLSGSGPAYVFEFIQAMIDGGVAMGLDAESAKTLTVQTLAGAAEMVSRGLGTPDELRKAVTSPNGTTAAGLEVLAEGDLRGLMAHVIKRATERSLELGS
ncbi:MAG TPA: pyrroline-5-carboxylate reductase [Lentisphaeria bacterium]|nr:pyrroline-5-carboxylate reductase [Lentisphaeria bacterium]